MAAFTGSVKSRIGRLHIITDTRIQQRYGHAELAELAIEGGADTIQYRSKSSDLREMLREAGEVGEVCRAANVTFIVNDRVDLCLAVNADGVHLGRGDMAISAARILLGQEKVIGGTVRNGEQAVAAAKDSADYVGFGPLFPTTSKYFSIKSLGIEALKEVRKVSPIPIIGIAGITADNLADVLLAGAHGVAVIGAVCGAQDVTVAARRLAARIAGVQRPEG